MTPPERIIILGLLVHFEEARQVCVDNSLDAECFHSPIGKWFYQAIQEMHRDGEEIDDISIFSKIEHARENKDSLMSEYGKLLQQEEPIISGSSYIPAVQSLVSLRISNLRRESCMAFKSITANSSDAELMEAENLRSETLKKIKAYQIKGVEFESTIKDVLKDVNLASQGKSKPPAFTIDWWPSFSSKFYDIMPHELVTSGARPGTGKTSITIGMLDSALRQGKRVFMGTFEMTIGELIKLIAANRTRTNPTKLEAEFPKKIAEFADEIRAIGESHEAGMVGFSEKCDIDDFEASVESFACKHGKPDAIFVDYLQLMKYANGGAQKKHEMLGECSRRLKQMTKRYKCPVIAAAQLNRDHSKEGTLPTKEDLKASGSIEEDSDRVILLHLAKKNSAGVEQEFEWLKEITIIQDKNRAGPWAKSTLKFNGPQRRFYEDVTVQSEI